MKAVWEGSFYAWHSLAHVNRELGARLGTRKVVNGIAPNDAPGSHRQTFPHAEALKRLEKSVKGESLRIRHSFPPNLSRHAGPVVLMQPWEFLEAPAEWVQAVRNGRVAELWCNSNFTRNVYVQSGVPAQNVRMLPLGYDAEVFKPDGPVAQIGEPDEFKFLYVGGTIDRKGIDVLMRAFLAEFRRSDPVRLIVKDTGTRHVYIHNNQSEPIKRAASDSNAPRITYLDDDYPPEELAALMRVCNVIAQPYRAEGFCLPVLEGMACGLAPIVTSGGPTDDFVLSSCGWRISAQRVQIPQLPGLESSGSQGWLEPDQQDLQQALRAAYRHQAQTKERGKHAAEIARELTWDKVADQYAERIKELTSGASREPKRKTISLCMIVKNEERVIGECLKSVQGVFDEIIVVDTGSTDRTPEICKEFGVTLRHFPWTDSFSEARNESMRDAKGDWIFWMDADDTLPPGAGEILRQNAMSAPPEVHAFVVPVQFLDEGASGGTRVDHVKLFRNLPGLKFKFRIHEQILESLRAHGGQIARSSAHVVHSGYDTSPEGQARKRERDWKLLMLDLKENPNHPFVLFNIGMTVHYVKDHKEAVRWLRRCLKHSVNDESHVRKAYSLLGVSLREMGQIDKAIETFELGLKAAPSDPDLHFQLALTQANIGEFPKAKANYLLALEADPSGHFSSFDIGILGYKTHHNLGSVEAALGNYAEAVRWLEQALVTSPDHLSSAFATFDLALENQDWHRATRMLNHILDRAGASDDWAKMSGRYSEVREGKSSAIALLGRMASDFADSPWPKMELCRRLLAEGHTRQAEPMLHELERSGVAEAAYCLGILRMSEGGFELALRHMELALQLNPGHEDTARQVSGLRKLIADQGGGASDRSF